MEKPSRLMSVWGIALRCLVVISVGSVWTACRESSSSDSRLSVFAAASLTSAFESLAQAFEAEHPGTRVALNFAGTPSLVMQIREGAPVSVFASADIPSMDRVLAGRTPPPVSQVFAGNRLLIITPKENSKGVESIADLAREDLRVLLCGPEVPAGRYARQALAKAGVTVHSRSDEPNVKSLLTKVSLGEADAGIVYASDMIGAEDRIHGIPLPKEHDVAPSYVIAVLGQGESGDLGRTFVNFVLGDSGKRVLLRHGFLIP